MKPDEWYCAVLSIFLGILGVLEMIQDSVVAGIYTMVIALFLLSVVFLHVTKY